MFTNIWMKMFRLISPVHNDVDYYTFLKLVKGVKEKEELTQKYLFVSPCV